MSRSAFQRFLSEKMVRYEFELKIIDGLKKITNGGISKCILLCVVCVFAGHL